MGQRAAAFAKRWFHASINGETEGRRRLGTMHVTSVTKCGKVQGILQGGKMLVDCGCHHGKVHHYVLDRQNVVTSRKYSSLAKWWMITIGVMEKVGVLCARATKCCNVEKIV